MDDIASNLLSGERLLWSGRPAQGLRFASHDVFLVPFSLLWAGFTVFWSAKAASMHAPPFFLLWGAAFNCIGIYFVAGRFVVDAYARSKTIYAVTSHRVLIARESPFKAFTAIALDRLPQASLAESSSGRGTIRFGDAPQWRRSGLWTPSLDSVPQFVGIDDAREVFQQIQQLTRQREPMPGS